MSDLSVSPRDAQKQLDDLKQDHERRLRDARTDFKRRESDIRESGEAAISHIRKDTEAKVEHARGDADSRLKKDAEQINRNYAELRRRAGHQSEALERNIVDTRERTERNISSIRANENAVMERSQERLRDFVRSQQELSAHAREVTNAEVEKTKVEGNKRLIGEKTRQFERVESLTSENRETMDELRSRSKALYDETRADAQRRLSQLKTKNETEVKTERERGHDSVNTLRKSYGDAVQHQQRDGERRLTQLDQENRRQLEQDRARAARVNTTMQAEYSSEAQRVETTGQREIEDRQAKYKHLFTEQQNTNNARLQQNEIELTAKEAKLRDEHFKRMAETQEKADETIIRQKSQFHERYDRADKSHKDSLGHQKEVYLKELYRQKERLDNKMGVEKARESDPFYQMKTFHAKLTENPGSYELTAQVAPHDRHNVDVRVQNDKIVLSAKRAYEDKFANEGVRTTTNAYQTFRQDFKLDVPVDAERVLTKIKEDGSVTVLVPKKGYVKKET